MTKVYRVLHLLAFAFAPFGLTGAFGAPPVPGSAIEVAPTRLDLAPGATGLLYVSNRGAAPVAVQFEAFDWRQSGNASALTPSASFIVSPPYASIAPGKQQAVRLLAAPESGVGEAAYRLLVSQLPPPDAEDANGVRLLIQFSVPIFISDKAPPAPVLHWNAALKSGAIELTLDNSGSHAVKFAKLELVSSRGIPIAVPLDNELYALAGSHRLWRLPAAGLSQGDMLRIAGHDARSDLDFVADLVLNP